MIGRINPHWIAPAYPNDHDHHAERYGCEGMPQLLAIAAQLMRPKHPDEDLTRKNIDRRARLAIDEACALMQAFDDIIAADRAEAMSDNMQNQPNIRDHRAGPGGER